jgi:hypothetical protein
MKRLISRGLPHLTIILSLMTLVLFTVDGFNAVMGFMANEISKHIFAVLAVCSIITSVMLIARFWKEDDRRARKIAKKLAAEEAMRAMESSEPPSEE